MFFELSFLKKTTESIIERLAWVIKGTYYNLSYRISNKQTNTNTQIEGRYRKSYSIFHW